MACICYYSECIVALLRVSYLPLAYMLCLRVVPYEVKGPRLVFVQHLVTSYLEGNRGMYRSATRCVALARQYQWSKAYRYHHCMTHWNSLLRVLCRVG